jgi:benzoylformate decarboxylase
VSTVRETTYEILRDLGMKVIFGNPGSTELPFLRDMPSDFKYVLGLHERVAAGMALGYSLGIRQPVFVNLHSIASTGNGLSAIQDAWYMHVPLVITAGQQDRRQLLSEPFLASRAVETVRPYVKWAYEPLRAEDVPPAVARGIHLAMQPPRGPVFISIPMDDWTHECPSVPARKVSESVLADPAALDEVVRALDSSRSPALVAGPQIEEDDGWHAMLALAEHLNASIYQDPIPSRWTFPRGHRLFLGGLLPAQRPLADQLAAHDVVIVFGARVFLYYAHVPGNPVNPGTRLFQITNDPQAAAAALAGDSVVGNVARAATYLRDHARARQLSMEEFTVPPGPGPRDEAKKSVIFWLRHRHGLSASEIASIPSIGLGAEEVESLLMRRPISAAHLFIALNKVMPQNAIIVEECPSSKGDLDRYLILNEPGSFYSVPNGVLGFALPAAVGLQLALPERRVVCPIGDGSVQYSVQALWSAVQNHAPVVVIVIRNSDYSALKGFCDFTQVGRNVPGMDIPGIDMVKIAQGYGMSAREVDQPAELEPALQAAFAEDAPCLISVNVAKGGQRTMGMDQSVNPPRYR